MCRDSNALGAWVKGSEARCKDLDRIVVPGQLLGPVPCPAAAALVRPLGDPSSTSPSSSHLPAPAQPGYLQGLYI